MIEEIDSFLQRRMHQRVHVFDTHPRDPHTADADPGNLSAIAQIQIFHMIPFPPLPARGIVFKAK